MKIPYKSVLLSPYILILLGSIANQIAVRANGGHMPVLFPGGDCSLLDSDDLAHSCMTHATHVKILCDWILSSSAVSSLGDFALEVGNQIQTPSLIAWVALVLRDVIGKKQA
jgi:hypothetical protein